jgi:carbamoyl-phosphate synthase large subunit
MSTLSAPHAVILSLRNWLGASRLPKAFQRAGWQVSTLSFPSLLLDRCRSTSAQFFLPDRGSEEDLIAAAREILVALRPTIVVPGDEAATELLQAVAATACRELPESDPLLVLLRDSLGDFTKHALLRDRRALANLAVELGVRAPAHAVVHSKDDAHAFAEKHGMPVVLKAEESFAGLGVSICNGSEALDAALTRLVSKNAQALANGVLLQSFVPGKTAMRALVAWRGQVLAGLSAIKVETHPGPTGPSSVVEFIEQPEMMKTVQQMIAALGYSGFASLDFILDSAGKAHLLEMNARPTPICHLGHYLGQDLCLRLYDAVAGKIGTDGDPAGLPKKVVLFPQEWVRDPHSPHLNEAFHDIPWEDPDLVEALVILARGQMRGGEWYIQEASRERMRQLLTRIEVPDPLRDTRRGA